MDPTGRIDAARAMNLIGSTVWVNVPDSGRVSRWAWVPCEVVGETRISWEIKLNDWDRTKFRKVPNGSGEYRTQVQRQGYDNGYRVLLTAPEVADAEFVEANRRAIAQSVEGVVSAKTLREIAALVEGSKR